MLSALATLADAMLNLVMWDEPMRRELRERHPVVFFFSIATVVIVVVFLVVVLCSLLFGKSA